MSETDLPTQRYREILDRIRNEFREEQGRELGWMNHAAEKLNRSQGFISQVYNGKRSVGPKTIRLAAEILGLPEKWFYEQPGTFEKAESDHPYDEALRKFERAYEGRFPPSVFRMLRASAVGRYGLSEGLLLDLAQRLSDVEQQTRRYLGPPVDSLERK